MYIMGNQLLYCGINFCTAESFSVLGNQFLYWGINFCTAEPISARGESTSVLRNQFLHANIVNFGLRCSNTSRTSRKIKSEFAVRGYACEITVDFGPRCQNMPRKAKKIQIGTRSAGTSWRNHCDC